MKNGKVEMIIDGAECLGRGGYIDAYRRLSSNLSNPQAMKHQTIDYCNFELENIYSEITGRDGLNKKALAAWLLINKLPHTAKIVAQYPGTEFDDSNYIYSLIECDEKKLPQISGFVSNAEYLRRSSYADFTRDSAALAEEINACRKSFKYSVKKDDKRGLRDEKKEIMAVDRIDISYSPKAVLNTMPLGIVEEPVSMTLSFAGIARSRGKLDPEEDADIISAINEQRMKQGKSGIKAESAVAYEKKLPFKISRNFNIGKTSGTLKAIYAITPLYVVDEQHD